MDITNNIPIDQRRAIIATHRKKGHNCVSALLAAFRDITHLSEDDARCIAAGLGGGIGGSGDTCGVIVAMGIIEGYISNLPPEKKQQVYARVREHIDTFRVKNQGMTQCRDIKSILPARSCDSLIFEGAEILHNSIKLRT